MGKNIEIGKEITRGVVSGGLQIVGGSTEALTGGAIFAATTWTGVGIPVGLAGGYIAVDGASNVTGGLSKINNSAMMNDKGDNLNFMKLGYKKISPEYG